jgi:hypothetical protein
LRHQIRRLKLNLSDLCNREKWKRSGDGVE